MTRSHTADAAERTTAIGIDVAGIAKAYGKYPALHGVDLNVAPGELVALLGPSGSGKTTLLRVIAGLEAPDAGIVRFGGADASGLRIQDRRVGFVFQHYALFKHMTVFDNIAYGLHVRPRSRRPSKSEIARRVGHLLHLVQLPDLAGRYPAQLSGGQRQRIALARALAIEPRVLLLDEPFGALDAKVRKDLRRWLRGIHLESGLTTVFVTHDQDEAMQLADRIAVLNQGRIEQVGTPADLYDRPATPFVMSFIGEAITLAAEVREGTAWVGGHATPLQLAETPDGPVELLVRPNEVELTSPDDAGLVGVVEAVRRTAGGYQLDVRLDSHPVPIGIDVADGPAKVGERIGLSLTGVVTQPSRAA